MNRSATKARASIALATMAMGLLLGCGTAGADPTATWLPGVFPWDISSDGSVVVGNTVGVYEAFRWTAESGVVPLGMNPGSHGMNGGGTPDVSEDGLHVSATIITPDTTGSTQGLWTKGVGWKWSMPPIPDLPDYPGMPDTAYVGMGDDLGSCWGLSGDGKTLTGFVWISRSGLGTAWGNTWSEEDGVVFLAKRARSFRINDANYDGSVTVGWSERDDGTRCPTVWEDGGYTVLHDSGWFCGAEGVSADGNTVWGQAYNPSNGTIEAAIWQRTESGWVEQIIGSLPGTFPGYGAAVCRATGTEMANWLF